MKRPEPLWYDYLWPHYGWFFWQDCACCKQSFRREHGFRYLSGPFVGGAGTFKYLCADCAPTGEAATQFIDHRPSRPPPPRPPPPRLPRAIR